ncbi:hypothetical protein N7466_004447 [Penicillium verhagenii]|uniref:uncharacterized protein n=1 Tax=Penicillium verhagenii TaxID=1562060 RepID=UPI002545584A|nr:uncharacterized protein N7466_004447 [Penicillium verhagenii]KAJ5934900.1 hypothetical protein N7466_004447 [Penicillium verhagenii]
MSRPCSKTLPLSFAALTLYSSADHRHRAYYGYHEENGGIPAGLKDTDMCLVANSVAIDSITTDMPWVYASDVSFDHASPPADGEYPGYFRVAIESVITELYLMLTAMIPAEL